MDSKHFDGAFLEGLGVSEERLYKILQSMIDDGLIDGFAKINYMGGYGFKAIGPRLTMKGMEFLQENSAMQKIRKELKEVKDLAPCI